MKHILIIVTILMALVSLNAITNVYLTNMANGAQQDTIDVLTGTDHVFATFSIDSDEPAILNSISFGCMNLNLGDNIEPSIQFTLYTNDGTWYAADNSIFNLNFQGINSLIQPDVSKTFVLMGHISTTSNGGGKFCLGIPGSLGITQQISGETIIPSFTGPMWDNIFHVVNVYQPMHRWNVFPKRNPQEIYISYYQDHIWTYAGQRFWNDVFISRTFNAMENSMVTISSNTNFGSTPGQLIINNLSFNEHDLPGLMYNWQPEYSLLRTSWFSPDTLGISEAWFYMNQVECHVTPNFIQSEYMNAYIGNYTSLIGMHGESMTYERVYHGYTAIKFDIDGSGTAETADALMWQQHNIGVVDLNNTEFNDNTAPNKSRVCIYYPHGNDFDAWVGYLWTLNHNIEIAQGLGIGLPYNGAWPGETGVTYNIQGNTVTADTDGNCVGVFGKLPNGEDWNTVILMNGAENLSWSSEYHSIEPQRIQMNREEIQIQIPVGLTQIDVLARNVNEYTANDDPTIPITIPTLKNASPNPFSTQTSISYTLPKSGTVSIEIYNVKGQLIRTLVSETKSSGTHNVTWNGTDDNNRPVAGGIYFYKMVSGKYTSTKKMVLVK